MVGNSTSQNVLEAIDLSWPELPAIVGDDWEVFEADVLALVCALMAAEEAIDEADAEDYEARGEAREALDAVQNRLLARVRGYPAARRMFDRHYRQISLRTGARGPEDRPVNTREHHVCVEIPVLYATDRRAAPAPDWYDRGRADSEELGYGQIPVFVPLTHEIGTLRKPRRWRPRLARHRRFDLGDPEPMPEDQFVAAARDAVRTESDPALPSEPPGVADGRDVLVFIHGYNVDFTEAALRAGQLAYDLGFPGVPMLFSWPSLGRLHGYLADRESAEWSAAHLAHFLRTLLTRLGARRVHVVAHSMGNKVLIGGLTELSLTEGEQLGHVVFAAPDFGAQLFLQKRDGFVKKAESYTIYASSKDLALRLSATLFGKPRAGQAGDGMVIADAIDTIDISRLPKVDGLGHSGFAKDRAILTDLRDLFRFGRASHLRAGLRSATRPDGSRYWIFPA